MDRQLKSLAYRLHRGAALIRTWPLTGGISAQMIAMEIALPDGQIVRRVMRRHGPNDLAQNPYVAADEFKLLKQLHALGVPVPMPYLLDQSGTLLPSPFIVTEFIDGTPDFEHGDMPTIAAMLVRLHTIDLDSLNVPFLQDQSDKVVAHLDAPPEVMDESLSEGRIRAALERVWHLKLRNASRLLHGDFWPGNLLWKDRQLVGIVDWEDAAVGDPLADVAISRLDLLWLFGLEAMQTFTDQYFAANPIDTTHLPYWDLWAALRPCGRLAEWAGDAEKERVMRERHHLFITQAFAQIVDRKR